MADEATGEPARTDGDRQAERDRMCEEQLAAPSDRRVPVVDARVLQAMRRVPREKFVDAELAARAYDDAPLAIGREQTISQPYMVGKMTELLELDAPAPGAAAPKVLEIGTGSGYQAAVLAALGARVFTVERDPELARTAAHRLQELGYAVAVRCADGFLGWPEEAPFEAIVVAAAPEEVPRELERQLADDGRLVVPVGPRDGDQELRQIRRRGDRFQETRLFPVRFVPMTGDAGRTG